jgi:hypothetical protein
MTYFDRIILPSENSLNICEIVVLGEANPNLIPEPMKVARGRELPGNEDGLVRFKSSTGKQVLFLGKFSLTTFNCPCMYAAKIDIISVTGNLVQRLVMIIQLQ